MESRNQSLPPHLDLRKHPLDPISEPQFTDRFVDLLEQVPNPATGRPWSNAALAETLTEDYECPVSEDYVRRLRNGERSNPTLRMLLAIMHVLQVPPGYFFQATIKAECDAHFIDEVPLRRSARSVRRGGLGG